MKKGTKKHTYLLDTQFSKIVECKVSPSDEDILSASLASSQAHLPTVDFRKEKGVNLDIHSIIIKEYHQIGDHIIIKGVEVVTREVVGVINVKTRKAQLKISNSELPFSREDGEEED